MRKFGNTDLRVVEAGKELPRRIRKKGGVWKKVLLAAVLVIIIGAGGFLFITHHTFGAYWKRTLIEFDNSSNNSYIKFGNHILKYSRDGAALLGEDGAQLWNQPYQMSTPMAVKNGGSVMIADQGGNTIEIFGTEGVKGEIRTGLPIEKATVSGQGITGVILREDDSARIVCYDTAGNILVEDQVAVNENGYPVAVALSRDGCTLMVSYILIKGSGISSRIACYDFSENTEHKTEKETMEKSIDGSVVPELFYMEDGIAAAVGEGRLIFFSEGRTPKVSREIELEEEIHSVAHSDEYVALILENQKGGLPYKLRVYGSDGNVVGSLDFKGDYSRVFLDGNTVILDAGTSCKIMTVGGLCLYDGDLDETASGILPVSGLFKYAVMQNNGMQIIQLIK